MLYDYDGSQDCLYGCNTISQKADVCGITGPDSSRACDIILQQSISGLGASQPALAELRCSICYCINQSYGRLGRQQTLDKPSSVPKHPRHFVSWLFTRMLKPLRIPRPRRICIQKPGSTFWRTSCRTRNILTWKPILGRRPHQVP